MAVDIVLKIDGIDGESSIAGHEKEIDVLSWSWSATQSGTMHVAQGGGTGKVSAGDMHITKFIDAASPKLASAVCTGKHIPKALLTVRKAGGDKALEYIKWEMNDCLISSVQPGGAASDERLMESMSINFAKFEFTYTPQKADGTAGSVIPAKFNIAKNQEK